MEDLQTSEISGASGWSSGGAVVWVTGISGAGKTTVCDDVANLVGDQVPELVRIDGDVVREVFGEGLGYKAADREIQIGRIQRLSRVLAEQGKLVLVTALYASDDLLSWNREHLPGYFS
jgi:cytidine diphosphoramidate kinase